jgi:hypothetical protein
MLFEFGFRNLLNVRALPLELFSKLTERNTKATDGITTNLRS